MPERSHRSRHDHRGSGFAWHMIPLVLGAAVMLVGWVGFIAGDVLGSRMVHDGMLPAGNDPPIFFLWYFQETGPAEQMQWLLLGATLVLALYIAIGAARRSQYRFTRVFLLGAVGLALMLAEDRWNVRLFLSWQITLPLFGGGLISRTFIRTATELIFYGLLGSIMISFLWASFRYFRSVDGAHRLILTGYILYAVAAVASASRYIGDWYSRAGEFGVRLVSEPAREAFVIARPTSSYSLGFWLMDLLIEESIELLAAAALASAFLWLAICWRHAGGSRNADATATVVPSRPTSHEREDLPDCTESVKHVTSKVVR